MPRRPRHKAFENFKSWKFLIENQTGKMLKRFKIDNGIKFLLQLFNSLCKQNDKERHQMVVDTQQNGFAERFC